MKRLQETGKKQESGRLVADSHTLEKLFRKKMLAGASMYNLQERGSNA